jgi:hypothetical protein
VSGGSTFAGTDVRPSLISGQAVRAEDFATRDCPPAADMQNLRQDPVLFMLALSGAVKSEFLFIFQ